MMDKPVEMWIGEADDPFERARAGDLVLWLVFVLTAVGGSLAGAYLIARAVWTWVAGVVGG